MLKPLKPWPYYPRTQLAGRYLDSPQLTGQRAITLFGGRGIGKTEFLRRDLEPLALKRGWRVAHADLQSNVDHPVMALIAALKAARSTTPSIGKVVPPLMLDRLELGAPLFKASAQRIKPALAVDPLEQLREALEKLKPTAKRPLCLVIDEVQILAHPTHEGLIAALRAAIQQHDEAILRIFTGSSRVGLERAFMRAKAPLFGQGGVHEVFPVLGAGFVQAVCAWFAHQTGGVQLNEAQTLQAFERLKFSARMLRTAVEAVLLGQVRSITEAAEYLRLHSPDVAQMQALIQELGPLEQAVLQAIHTQRPGLFGEAFLIELSAQLGQQVSVPMVLNAVRTLERRQWIQRLGRGSYVFENAEIETAYEQWIESRSSIALGQKARLR